MVLVEKLDELGKPAWIALMILGFIVWWPLGLVTLAFILGSGRMAMGCWGHHNDGSRWQQAGSFALDAERVVAGATCRATPAICPTSMRRWRRSPSEPAAAVSARARTRARAS